MLVPGIVKVAVMCCQNVQTRTGPSYLARCVHRKAISNALSAKRRYGISTGLRICSHSSDTHSTLATGIASGAHVRIARPAAPQYCRAADGTHNPPQQPRRGRKRSLTAAWRAVSRTGTCARTTDQAMQLAHKISCSQSCSRNELLVHTQSAAQYPCPRTSVPELAQHAELGKGLKGSLLRKHSS